MLPIVVPFTIEQATTEDASAIANVFLSDATSDFLRLQLGTVDPTVLNEGMIERLTESFQKPDQAYMIARDDKTGEVVSFAQWQLPRDEMECIVEQRPEEKARETEEYRKKLLVGMNEALTLDFRERLHVMRGEVLKGRRHYSTVSVNQFSAYPTNLGAVLCNLGTLPKYQRRGAASALVHWPFKNVDQDGIVIYFDTNQDGSARKIYERLGFNRVGDVALDLSQYGSSGVHTHIAMIREPQRQN